MLSDRIWLRSLATFALTVSTGVLGYALPSFGGRLTLIVVPSGIAVAASYRWGRGMWAVLLAAGIAIELSVHTPPIAAICVGAGLSGGAALTARLLRRRDFDANFVHARDVPLFIAAAAVGMSLASALGCFGYYLAGIVTASSDPLLWLRWWGNTMAGAITIAPVIIAASSRSLEPIKEHRLLAVLWLWGIALCCVLILLPLDGQIVRPLALVYSLFLIVVGAMYFGLVAAASASLLIWLWTAYCVAFGRGAFAELDVMAGRTMIWSVSSVLSGVTLVITALLAERDAAAREKLQAERRYAQIFEGNPQPMWLLDSEGRFLMVNEAAIRLYGYTRAQFLAMRAAALVAKGEPAKAPQPQDPSDEAEPFETRHVTRDGRILQVEVWTRAIDLGGEWVELVFALDVTERRAFGQALIDAIAGEQRRIGQEMHDGLGQELTGLALSARALANRAARERDSIAGDLDELASIATSCIQDARLIVQGLSPLTDADGSLEAALESLARRSSLSGTPVRFRARNAAPLGIDLKARNHLYRIAQEAVQNALKHAGARSIEIELLADENGVRLEVIDDGRGLPADDTRAHGLGLRTMRFRASAIGGRVAFTRRAGGGNSVLCEAPQSRI